MISPAEKIRLRDFFAELLKLEERLWTPDSTSAYWESLCEQSQRLIDKYQNGDKSFNDLVLNTVIGFINSRGDQDDERNSDRCDFNGAYH